MISSYIIEHETIVTPSTENNIPKSFNFFFILIFSVDKFWDGQREIKLLKKFFSIHTIAIKDGQ
jgi:hypothetical protein